MSGLGKAVEVELDFTGNVNGSVFRCAGKSRGTFGDGDITAVLGAKTAMPAGMDISLLSYVLLTGQPAMSRVLADAVNPFIGTGGVHEGTRLLELGAYGYLTTTYRVESTGRDRLRATFDAMGDVHVPRLVSIAPCVETWTPTGPGRVNGQFTTVWTGEDGTRVQGKTDTSYVLPTEETIPGQQFRELRIDIETTATTLKQTEHVVLFTPKLLEEALRSLPAPLDTLGDVTID
jgi:hypothetical protein